MVQDEHFDRATNSGVNSERNPELNGLEQNGTEKQKTSQPDVDCDVMLADSDYFSGIPFPIVELDGLETNSVTTSKTKDLRHSQNSSGADSGSFPKRCEARLAFLICHWHTLPEETRAILCKLAKDAIAATGGKNSESGLPSPRNRAGVSILEISSEKEGR